MRWQKGQNIPWSHFIFVLLSGFHSNLLIWENKKPRSGPSPCFSKQLLLCLLYLALNYPKFLKHTSLQKLKKYITLITEVTGVTSTLSVCIRCIYLSVFSISVTHLCYPPLVELTPLDFCDECAVLYCWAWPRSAWRKPRAYLCNEKHQLRLRALSICHTWNIALMS